MCKFNWRVSAHIPLFAVMIAAAVLCALVLLALRLYTVPMRLEDPLPIMSHMQCVSPNSVHHCDSVYFPFCGLVAFEVDEVALEVAVVEPVDALEV